MTELLPATDDDFAWMLGGASTRALALPSGGVEDPAILKWLRRTGARVRARHDAGVWMMTADGEVVGLCGYKRPADAEGAVEIGYGVAASKRRCGHATRAVAMMVEEARGDPLVRSVMAETAVDNIPSQRALEANGFARVGERTDAEDGELILWRRDAV